MFIVILYSLIVWYTHSHTMSVYHYLLSRLILPQTFTHWTSSSNFHIFCVRERLTEFKQGCMHGYGGVIYWYMGILTSYTTEENGVSTPPHPTLPPHTHTNKHHLLSVVPDHSLMEWWRAQCCVGNPSCSNSCVNSQVFWSCHVLKTLSQSSPSQPLTLSSVPGCSWSLVGEGFLWTVTPRNKK